MTTLRAAATPAALLMLASAALVGCETDRAESTGGSGADRFVASVSAYGYGDTVDRTPPWYESLEDLLPTVAYAMPGGTQTAISELVVVGRGVTVEPGRSGKDLGNDTWVNDASFDDPDAMSRTVHVLVEVDSSIGSTEPIDSLLVGFAVSPDVTLDDVSAWFAQAGQLVLFLQRSPVFDYDVDLWGVVLDGAMVAQVGADGTLVMPFTPRSVADRLLGPTPTLDALVAASRSPRTIELTDRGGFLEPAR